MPLAADHIREFFLTLNKGEIKSLEKLPRSGGDRIYFRITTETGTDIATYNENIKENIAFLSFSGALRKIGAPVPEIYIAHPEKRIYLQEDLGNSSLLDRLEAGGYTEEVYELFKKSLKALAWLQIKGDEVINYDHCITSREFGRQAIMSDLLYFKYYFLDTLKIPYDKEKLIDDFETLSTYLDHVDYKYFMFRDFQSRNIYIKNDEVRFIDYQGGMKGALQYDVASLLWQAKANLPDTWKNGLLEYYMDRVSGILQKPLDRVRFASQYNGYVLIRLLQVLGAYGFRGLFERKAHFLVSIPLGLNNLKWFLDHKETGVALPEFERVLRLIIEDNIISQFKPIQADQHTRLVVTINSFSYLKTGYPGLANEHGGGFVFDCRGLENPGKIEEFMFLTGRDKPVIDFLEQQTRMPDFLNSVYTIVDIAVENYLQRNFTSLVINFGCTGGKHRSVYAADALTRHLRNKFKVKIDLYHLEQNIHEPKGF
jgi:aminoglycoside/choline kinase family phosphotransferase